LESRWRFGVWEWGVANIVSPGRPTLAVRLHDGINPIPIVLVNQRVGAQVQAYWLPGSVDPDRYVPILLPGGVAAFPYGYGVEHGDHA
jgi:hypothetical protein